MRKSRIFIVSDFPRIVKCVGIVRFSFVGRFVLNVSKMLSGSLCFSRIGSLFEFAAVNCIFL